MLFRLLVTLLVSRLHPPFPPEFDLSAAPHPPCRIFNRTSFSQKNCGACAAFAASTAYAMRECVRSGRDVIPSPHRLFDCGGGECMHGAVMGSVVKVLDEVEDVDDSVEEFGLQCNRTRRLWHSYAVYRIRHDDERMLKTELYVYGNPVMAVIEPDLEMSQYTAAFWRRSRYSVDWGSEVPIPVYHVTGPPIEGKAHVVVVLGWGSDPEPYWVVQNSWGDIWGDLGRGRIAVRDVVDAVVLDYFGWRTDGVLVFAFSVLVTALLATFECCMEKGKEASKKEKVEDDGCVVV